MSLTLSSPFIVCGTQVIATYTGYGLSSNDIAFYFGEVSDTPVLLIPGGASEASQTFTLNATLAPGQYTLVATDFDNEATAILTVAEGPECQNITSDRNLAVSSQQETITCNENATVLISGFKNVVGENTVTVVTTYPNFVSDPTSYTITDFTDVVIYEVNGFVAGQATVTATYTSGSTGQTQTGSTTVTLEGANCQPNTLALSPRIINCGDKVTATLTSDTSFGTATNFRIYVGGPGQVGVNGTTLIYSRPVPIPVLVGNTYTHSFPLTLAPGDYTITGILEPVDAQQGSGGTITIHVNETSSCYGIVGSVYPDPFLCDQPFNFAVSGVVGAGTISMFIDGEVVATLETDETSLVNMIHSVTIKDIPSPGLHVSTATFTPTDGDVQDGPDFSFTVSSCGGSGGDPHIVCLDGSRLDVYDAGYYRFFDNLQTEAKEKVVMNASIVRNSKTREDLYDRIWIKIGTQEEQILFRKSGIVLKSNPYARGVANWVKEYIDVEGVKYVLTCESQYHTVGLTISKPSVGYCGLLAGQVVKIGALHYGKPIAIPEVYSHFTHNALLCGSLKPHLITTAKQLLLPCNGTYRYLQFPGGCLNVMTDFESRARKLVLYQAGSETLTWEWNGYQHWNLTFTENGVAKKGDYLFAKELGDKILLRVQGNGAISLGFRDIRGVSGLALGQMVEVDMNNTEELEMPLIDQFIQVQGNSLYERLIAPVMV